ncbi:GNAT family N-acetyltransferase [uncultured Jatrophihabitans sp.]|uniref:GNAT family N-acetyltransferase n=1 Tax=uncultured Jatrophihabitans sp. TaxID=1610747 RepID=UPI0035CC4B8E
MGRQVVPLTLDNLSDLPGTCRRCVYWELAPAADTGADAALDKEAWVSDTLLEWGTCGQLAYSDGRPVGYVLYAPPGYVPRATGFPTSPVGADAVLLMTAYVTPQFRNGGIGRVLAQTTVREMARRGYRALEAFGRTGDGDGTGCVLPAAYLTGVGFTVIRRHPTLPRLRLDVRGAVTWRAEMEGAIERLLGGITSPAATR